MKTSILLLIYSSILSFIFNADIPQKPEDISPLLIGETIPSVNLIDIEANTQNLLDLAKSKPTIFIFYRGSWCPYCNKHLADLQKYEADILSLGYQVVALSPDQIEYMQETIKKNQNLNYTLLSDSEMTAAKAFGVAYEVEQSLIDKYKSKGLDLNKQAGQTHNLLPAPSVFVVNTEGKIIFEHINPNYKERLSGKVLLAVLKAYQ